tara:strand:- start:484 stop:1695 length:1212 start_codon:yes stop_codon:yes gene_type:complete
MAVYYYVAINSEGNKEKGVIAADNLENARRELRNRKLAPLKVSENNKYNLFNLLVQRKISLKNLVLFTRQLSALIGGGLPLDKSLKLIGNQSKNGNLKNQVLTLSSRIEEGFSFTEALKEFPQSFDNLYISLISAGEAAGDMSGILEKTASYLERRSKIQQDIIGALIYPLVLIILALVIVGLLLVFVVPNVVNQFDTLNQQLPLLTRVLISISDFLSGPAIWISLAILILLLGISRLIGRNKIRFLFEKHILKIPLINSFLINANLARFTSSLSILRNSNVPIIEALNISTSTISNSFLKGKMNEALSKVSEGDSLAKSLNKVQEIPLLVIQMIDSGERSGELDSMLTKAAEYLDQDFQQSTKIAMNLLEPMVVVLMGSIVASIVVAVLLPLIQMNNLTLIG